MGSRCVRAVRPAGSIACDARVFVEGDIFEAVDFSGPPCLPFRQCWVVLGAVQGIVDSRPLRVGVDGNVGDRCGVYPDSLCGPRLGRLVVVSQGCAFNGCRALGGYKEMHGLR